MATIKREEYIRLLKKTTTKSFTDIEQSKKLAEILPLICALIAFISACLF